MTTCFRLIALKINFFYLKTCFFMKTISFYIGFNNFDFYISIMFKFDLFLFIKLELFDLIFIFRVKKNKFKDQCLTYLFKLKQIMFYSKKLSKIKIIYFNVFIFSKKFIIIYLYSI